MPAQKRQRGRPKFEPTDSMREKVKTLAGFGVPENDICFFVENPSTGKPISPHTLRQYFRRELDSGMVEADAKVVETLYQQAIAGNVAACIWWTKGRMGWSEKVKQEVTGKDGGPIEIDDAREQLAGRIASVASRLRAKEDSEQLH